MAHYYYISIRTIIGYQEILTWLTTIIYEDYIQFQNDLNKEKYDAQIHNYKLLYLNSIGFKDIKYNIFISNTIF